MVKGVGRQLAAAAVNVGRQLAAAALLASTLACPESAPRDGLSDTELLTRASLDVRGRRPTLAELDLVRAHPERVDALVSGFVDDAQFGDRVRDWWAPAFRTRIDGYAFPGEMLGVEDAKFQHSVGEEPLALVAHVAVNDLPYTDIVTADYVIADDTLLQVWPLMPLEPLPGGLTRAEYADARPLAGVLSMNAFYWRHTSTEENANRGRTNAWSQALLCQDYLAQPIDFPRDVDLTDTESIHHAIKENSACLACHHTMDPIASAQWGFMQYTEDPASWALYHPAQEHDWMTRTGRAPGYYGAPVVTLTDLGRAIGSDERFVQCAVKRVYEGLLGRRATDDDRGALAEHRERFVASGLRIKALVRSVLRDESYRGRAWTPRFGGAPAAVPLKIASVEQVDAQLLALTGYQMRVDGRSALALDNTLRALAGGSDHGSARAPSTGLVLAQRRLAEAAARFVVTGPARDDDESVRTDEARTSPLGRLVPASVDTRPSRAQIGALVQIALSRETSVDEIDALLALWGDVYALQYDGAEAWTALIAAVLSDPEVLLW